MNITKLLNSDTSVQIVCSLADLKEVFREWQAERDAEKPEPPEDKMLSAGEAANILGVTNVTLWRWGKIGYLVPSKAGKKTFYWQSQIDKLLRKEG